jgi:hypothetical protein
VSILLYDDFDVIFYLIACYLMIFFNLLEVDLFALKFTPCSTPKAIYKYFESILRDVKA